MSEKEKQSVQLKGQLRLYMQLPAVMAVLLAILNIWIYRMDRRAGLLMLIFVIIYIIMVGFLYIYSKSIIMKDLVEFAAQYGIVQNVLLRELAIPYAILLDENVVMTNHHPVTHTVLLGGCLKLGTMIGNDNLGLFFYSIIFS